MLKVERHGPVARIWLDRPEVRNAFNSELIAALHQAVVESGAARVVVLAGAGKAFCAGGDLEWMKKAADATQEQNEEDAFRLACLYQAISDSQAVVVARIHGACFGGGCGLVAAADYAIAAEDAVFCFSEARLGLLPATISPFVLRKIGPGHARALFATALAFGAPRAASIGLVHESAPADQLDLAVDKVIEAVLACGPEAAAESKRLAQAPPMDNRTAARLLAKVRTGEEAKAGIAAFLSKQPAPWVVKP